MPRRVASRTFTPTAVAARGNADLAASIRRGRNRSASSSGAGAMASVPSAASDSTRGRLTTEAQASRPRFSGSVSAVRS